MMIPYVPILTQFTNQFVKLSTVQDCKVHNGRYIAFLLPYNVWYVTIKCENESQANTFAERFNSLWDS
jgi:hypothetical protein